MKPPVRLLALALAFVLFLPATSRATGTGLIWGEPEILGLQRIARAEVLRRLPLTPGAPMREKERDILRWCDDLRALPVAGVHCAGAVERDRVHLVVEIAEQPGPPAGLRAATGAPVAGRLPAEASALLRRREYRMQELAAEGRPANERITPSGVVVADDPELTAFDAQLREQCMGRAPLLISVVQDPQHPERTEAVQLLAWAGTPEDSVAALSGRLLDPDPAVRSAVGQFVLTFLDRVEDEEVLRALVAAFTAQAALPLHTDRTKAVPALARLARQHPALRPDIALLAGPTLARLAQESVLAEVGGQARAALAVLPELR